MSIPFLYEFYRCFLSAFIPLPAKLTTLIDKFKNGYVVYGELDILKLSPTFDIEWSFSGEDIFVSQDGSMPFQIANDTIYLSDWNGRKYTIDRYGKEITE